MSFDRNDDEKRTSSESIELDEVETEFDEEEKAEVNATGILEPEEKKEEKKSELPAATPLATSASLTQDEKDYFHYIYIHLQERDKRIKRDPENTMDEIRRYEKLKTPPISPRTLSYFEAKKMDFKKSLENPGSKEDVEKGIKNLDEIHAPYPAELKKMKNVKALFEQKHGIFIDFAKQAKRFYKDRSSQDFKNSDLGKYLTIAIPNPKSPFGSYAATSREDLFFKRLLEINRIWEGINAHLKNLEDLEQNYQEAKKAAEQLQTFIEDAEKSGKKKLQYAEKAGTEKIVFKDTDEFYRALQSISSGNTESKASLSSRSDKILTLGDDLTSLSYDDFRKQNKENPSVIKMTLKGNMITSGYHPTTSGTSVHRATIVQELSDKLDRTSIFTHVFNTLPTSQKQFLLKGISLPHDKAAIKKFFSHCKGFPLTKETIEKFLKEKVTDISPRSASELAEKFLKSYDKTTKAPSGKRACDDMLNVIIEAHFAAVALKKSSEPIPVTGNNEELKWNYKVVCEAMKLFVPVKLGGREYTKQDFEYHDLFDNRKPSNSEIKEVKKYLVETYFPKNYYDFKNSAEGKAYLKEIITPQPAAKTLGEKNPLGYEDPEDAMVKAAAKRGGIIQKPGVTSTISVGKSIADEKKVEDDDTSTLQVDSDYHPSP